MNEIFVVGSYCDTAQKLEALESLLIEARKFDIRTLVIGKYPIPKRAQRLCDYFLFDNQNQFIANRAISYWHTIYGIKVSDIFPDHGLAALSQITLGLSVVKSLNYDIAYWVNYDVDLTTFSNFAEVARSSIKMGNQAVGFEFTKKEPLSAGMCLTNIAFKVNAAAEKLNGVLTERLYRRTIEVDPSLFAEDVMREAIDLSELKCDLLDPALNFPASITVMGDRLNGKINSQVCLQYFSNCFIGFCENTDRPGCFIWTILTPNIEIDIDFGNFRGTFSNENSLYIFIDLEEPPSQCRIISINGEPVNELIDRNFSPEYWGRHRIRKEEL